jgi:hypothetical protein
MMAMAGRNHYSPADSEVAFDGTETGLDTHEWDRGKNEHPDKASRAGVNAFHVPTFV